MAWDIASSFRSFNNVTFGVCDADRTKKKCSRPSACPELPRRHVDLACRCACCRPDKHNVQFRLCLRDSCKLPMGGKHLSLRHNSSSMTERSMGVLALITRDNSCRQLRRRTEVVWREKMRMGPRGHMSRARIEVLSTSYGRPYHMWRLRKTSLMSATLC